MRDEFRQADFPGRAASPPLSSLILHPSSFRRGFTLVELLVVLSLIVILMSLTAAALPGLQRRQKVARGVGLLQGWLRVAQQQALRDRMPTGVRLQRNADNPLVVTELSYIQQPDDFYGGLGSSVAVGWPSASVPPNIVVGAGVDFAGGFAGQPSSFWPVQPGDYLETQGGGWVRRITAVRPSALQLASAPPTSVPPTAQYRIIRQPRGQIGEPPLLLPSDMVIDLTLSRDVPVNALTKNLDILFSPSGQGIGAPADKIILWVRDVSRDDALQGEPALVVIYVRSGTVAVRPVDPSGVDPYHFTRDAGPSEF
jgi:prepilin-type N-terminal cleavage/methylation domain-containing protein